MKNLFTLLFAAFFTNAVIAQAPYFSWGSGSVTAANSTTLMYANNVTVDALGNVYTIGRFNGTVDFNPGSGTANLTSNLNSTDIFIQKLNAAGNYVWAKNIGSAGTESGYDIAVDGNGNVYSVGFFNGVVDFDPGSGTANLTSAGASDVFILKLDADGNYIWAKSMGGGGAEFCYGVAIDDGGNVYTTGVFFGTVDFDPGSGTANLSSAGAEDIFIQKLDTDGNYVWAQSKGSTGTDSGNGIATDGSGNVYTMGYFRGTVDFDPGAATANLTSAGISDIFIQKLDTDGNYVWAKRMGSTNIDEGDGIKVDGSGNVYITGNFSGTVDFDPGGGTASLTSAGVSDIFIQKLDTDGNYVWAKQMGSTNSDYGTEIAVDPSGNVVTTGYFDGTVDFNPGAGTANLVSAGGLDVFIQKLDAAGNYIWANRLGGSGEDKGFGIVADGPANVYVAGQFQGAIDINPTSGTSSVTGNNYGIFTIKLSNCNTSNIANSLDNNTLTSMGNTQTLLFTSSCRQIAKLLPNGASPVSGGTTAKVWIEPTQPLQFVKRHYEITPAANATTATGRVTLYFTQTEFDDFNAVNTIDLPTGAADATGKANLLIEKRGGTSGDGTGLPGSYTGTIEDINPADADIVWNSTLNRWEITFDVTGFSGFFLKTQAGVLPLTLTNFSGNCSNDVNNLYWQTQNEVNTKHFIVERSSDANSFTAIATIAAKGSGANTYSYNDAVKQNGKLFYRLKMADNDGRFTYSGVIALTGYTNSNVTVSPNPVNSFTTVTVTSSLLNTKAVLSDAAGKTIKQIILTHTGTSINFSAYPAGMYLLKLQNGQVVKLIKE